MSLLLAATATPDDPLPTVSPVARGIVRRVVGNGRVWTDGDDAAVVEDSPIFAGAKYGRQTSKRQSGAEWFNPDYFDELPSISVRRDTKRRSVSIAGIWVNPDYFDELPQVSISLRGKPKRNPSGSIWLDQSDPVDDGLPVFASGSIEGRSKQRLSSVPWIDSEDTVFPQDDLSVVSIVSWLSDGSRKNPYTGWQDLNDFIPPVYEEHYGAVHLGKHKYKGLDAETEEEKEIRRIAAGLLPPKAVAVIQKAAKRIIDRTEIEKELEIEFHFAMLAQLESGRLRDMLWRYELARIQDDEDAAILLLL